MDYSLSSDFGFVVPNKPTTGLAIRVFGWRTRNYDECGNGPVKFMGWLSMTMPDGLKFVKSQKSEEVARSTRWDMYQYSKVFGYLVSPAAGSTFVSADGVPNDKMFQGVMQPIGWLLEEA